MRRVLYLITELDVGGAEKSLFELARRLDRSRFEPVVACLSGRGAVAGWLIEAGIPVIFIDMRSWWDAGAWLRLRRCLRQHRPHVLHTFLFHANLAGRLAALKLGIPKIIASVRVEEPRRWHLLAERLTNWAVDVVTCVSQSACRYIHERANIPMEKLVAIPNGIDPTSCDAAVLATPTEWAIPEKSPLVAWIGRLEPQKNPLMMLRAARLVLSQIPDAIFAFAGQGKMEGRCRRMADEMGISANVRWLGWLPDVRPLLGRMDLLALSSDWEGMPNVILEAMCCRKPVVATNVGGCPELVVHGQTGLLVPRGDEKAFAEAILRLLRDGDLRKRLGEAARKLVEADFSIENMVRRNEALYE